MLTPILAASLLAGAALQLDAVDRPCQECHLDQASAWRTSKHAASTTSPLYVAMREWARADGGEAAAAICVTCHSVATDAGTRTDSVTCVVCHRGRADGPGPANWQVVSAGIIAAPRGGGLAPHPVRTSPLIAEARVCLVCHDELISPAGVPLCTTGPEARAGGYGATCRSCHVGHSFPGATGKLLEEAATLAVAVESSRAVVTVTNSGAGHGLPTGPVLRQVRLQVEAADVTGRVLWNNRDDGDALFAKVLQDAEGNAPVPPWRAAAVQRDTRLAPAETRRFSYPLPAGTARVVAKLVYHRAPEPILERLGLAGTDRPAPMVMTSAAAEVSAAPPRP